MHSLFGTALSQSVGCTSKAPRSCTLELISRFRSLSRFYNESEVSPTAFASSDPIWLVAEVFVSHSRVRTVWQGDTNPCVPLDFRS